LIVILTNADTSLSWKRVGDNEPMFVLCDTTDGDFEIDIPDATAREGSIPFKVKGGGSVWLKPMETQLIDDLEELEVTDTVTIQSDLNDWWVI
jgi:hypothetical protein